MVKLSPLVVENAVEVAPADVVELEETVALLVVVDALVVDVEVLITSVVVVVVAVPRMFNERNRASLYKHLPGHTGCTSHSGTDKPIQFHMSWIQSSHYHHIDCRVLLERRPAPIETRVRVTA